MTNNTNKATCFFVHIQGTTGQFFSSKSEKKIPKPQCDWFIPEAIITVAMAVKLFKLAYSHDHLMMGFHSEKLVVRQFCHCENIIEYAYTNPNDIAYYIPKLYCIAYCF